MLRAWSEYQNCTPYWNSSDANTTTNSVGTAAITENNATSWTCRRARPPIGNRAARFIAIRRPSNTSNAPAGSRLATSSKAITAGLSKAREAAPVLMTK